MTIYKIYHSFIARVLVAFLIFSLVSFGFFTNQAKASTTNFRPQSDQEYLSFLYGQLLQLQLQLEILIKQKAELSTRPTASASVRESHNPYFVQITSLAPQNIERTTARLQGRVDIGGSGVVDTWFEYGVGGQLNNRTDRVKVTTVRESVFRADVTDLRANTTYSYRAVAEDKDGNRQYGQTRTFTTIRSASTLSFSGRPTLENEGVANVTSNGAEIKGFISMNDYKTGIAFFVFGTDRTAIGQIENHGTFKDIPVIRGQVDKRSVNQNFTGRSTVVARLSGLSKASTTYYRVCVEYATNSGVTDVRCSSVGSFITAN